MAALICDPKPGDVGLAVFAQQDVSTLTGGASPQQPGSFRCYDMSDGFYLGGFWGQTPTTFVRIEDSGDITITAPETVVVNTNAKTINATSSCDINTQQATINTPQTHITGNVQIDGNLSVKGHISGLSGLSVSGGGGASVTGSLTTTGDVTAGGISLQGHVHTCPDGETGTPH